MQCSPPAFIPLKLIYISLYKDAKLPEFNLFIQVQFIPSKKKLEKVYYNHHSINGLYNADR